MQPKVTVLMSVYNGAQYLQLSVQSILTQTFSDFEFLIIDDGSDDNTWQILNLFNDKRIRLFRNSNNIGLIKSLNKGLIMARGEYIARMDVDDISLPSRLEKETLFLNHNPDVALVGSWVDVIDETGKRQETWYHFKDSFFIKWNLLFKNALAHSSVMFRKNLALEEGGYHHDFVYAEDYDLWSRLSLRWEIANIPEVLVNWRKWGGSISSKKQKAQKTTGQTISRRNMEYIWGAELDEYTFNSLRSFYVIHVRRFDANNIKDLIYNIKNLADRYIHKFSYKRQIANSLKSRIIKHMFSLIINSTYNLTSKLDLLFHLFIIFKLDIFRMVSYPFLKNNK